MTSNAPRCRCRRVLNGRCQLLFTWKLVVFLAVYNVVCRWHLPLLVVASSPSSWSSSEDDVKHRYVNWLEEEHGVKVLINEDSFQQALEEGAASFRHGSVLHQQPPQLLLTLVTAASCPHSAELLATMEQAIPLVQEYWNDPIRQASLQSKPRPLFGKIDGSKLEDPALLQRMGVVAYPTLLFVSNVEGQQQQQRQQHPAHSYRHRHREYPEQEEEDDNTDDITTTTKLVFLDYLGLHDTPQHLAETVLLFYYRMVVAPRHYTNDTIMVHVLPIPMATLHHVQAFVEQHTPGFLRPTRSLTLSPELSQEERDYITWLLSSFRWNQPLPRSNNSDSDDADTTLDDLEEDDLIVFVQCRGRDNTVVDSRAATWTTVFDEMSTLLSSRPDRAFFSVGDCSPEQLEARDVVAYRLPATRTAVPAQDWNELPHVSYMEVLASSSTNSLDLKSFLVQQATPSVLWFDRQSTAPILFHKSRKVHAVLFVDMHYPMLHDDHNHHDAAAAAAASGGGGGGSSSNSHPHSQNKSYSPRDLRQQEIVRQFQTACRLHQRRQLGNDDMACLIVPSTETRILTTFGIDIWSHWDANITTRSGSPPRQDATTSSSTTHHPPDMLPVVLITDQRIPGNTLRYYLEPGAIISKSTAIVDFVQDFWANRLKPEILSSGSMSPRRKGRAIALTGQTFDLELLQQGHAHHRLVLFYAPTCGHCKRFFLLWNQLADLIKYVEWDSFLTLYKLDVTDNEVHHPAEWNMTLHWLPDLYYFPPSLPAADGDSDRKLQEQPIRYYREDTRGDGVGRLNHPLEVLEWLLDVGDFDEFALLRLLEREEVSKSSHNLKETVFPRQDKKAEGASAND